MPLTDFNSYQTFSSMFTHFSDLVWEFTLPPYLFGFTINYLLTLVSQTSVYLCIMYEIKYATAEQDQLPTNL